MPALLTRYFKYVYAYKHFFLLFLHITFTSISFNLDVGCYLKQMPFFVFFSLYKWILLHVLISKLHKNTFQQEKFDSNNIVAKRKQYCVNFYFKYTNRQEKMAHHDALYWRENSLGRQNWAFTEWWLLLNIFSIGNHSKWM